ncbi:MAG: cobalt-precorrin-6A reductase [Acidimicrobiia bacterium]
MAAPRRILILGGSAEASALARHLAPREEHDVTVSFAGRTRERVPTPGAVRVGGFGGIEGLASYLESEHVDVLLDATHPFAARMPHHAAAACRATGVPRLRVCRPPWAQAEGDRWLEVADLEAAAARLRDLDARRVFLTTGRQELAPFAHVRDAWFLVRAIESPATMPLANASVVLGRGPFEEASELALMTEYGIDVLVTKNSGGRSSEAKLHAARRLQLPVVMIDRPPPPDGPRATTVEEAVSWLAGLESGGQDGPTG